MARSSLRRERIWVLALLGLLCLGLAWRILYLERLGEAGSAGALHADARIYWDWSEWILQHGFTAPAPFFLAPLYPYALALVRAAGTGSLQSVLLFQAFLGAGSAVVLAAATARVAGRPAGLAMGTVLALGQATTFFDGLLLPESLLFFVESGLVWLVLRTDWASARWERFAAYGLLVGMLAQGRASHAVLLVPGLLLVTGSVRRARAAAAIAAAFLACCVPAALANHRTSGEWIPFTYNLGFNLYVGNNPEADGTYTDVTGGSAPVPLEGTSSTTGGALDGRAYLLASEGRRFTPAGSSARWAEKAAHYVRTEPAAALRLAGRKVLLAWNSRPIPQIESMDALRTLAGPLGLPVLGSFGFLALLGLVGAMHGFRRGATVAERWLLGYVVLLTLAMTPFFVTDRYRHHLTPALAACAGLGITGLARSGARVRLRSGFALAGAAALVFAPLPPRDARLTEWAAQADRAIRLLDDGRVEEALAVFAVAERALPDVGAETLRGSARTALAAFHLRHGIALETAGRHGDAMVRWERAVAVNPADVESLGRLRLAYEGAGRRTDAFRVRQQLQATPGGRGTLLLQEGWGAAARGDLTSAETLLLRAIRESPDLSMAWEGLIRLRLQTGRGDEAASALEQARGAGIDRASADIYEAVLALQRGDVTAARRALGRIPREPGPRDPVLARLLGDARRALALLP